MRAETNGAAVMFFDHMDDCARCKVRPFDLCAIGANLLRGAAEHAGRDIEAWLMGGSSASPAEPREEG